jgi:hypothetical protein
MGDKKKTSNKEFKPKESNKPKAINWESLEDNVIIIGLGGKLEKDKEYTVTKATAKLIVNAKTAKLK